MDTSCSSPAATGDCGLSQAPLTECRGGRAEGSKIDVGAWTGPRPANSGSKELGYKGFSDLMRQDDAVSGGRIAAEGGRR